MLKRNSSKADIEANGVKGNSNQPTIHNESFRIHYRKKFKKGEQKKEKQEKKKKKQIVSWKSRDKRI